MSNAALTPPTTPATRVTPPGLVVLRVPTAGAWIEDVEVPPIADLRQFREWTYSDAFPERGRVSYLAGEIWVDLMAEQLYSHNQVKQEFSLVLGGLVKRAANGLYMPDGMRVVNGDADLSNEPDGMFAFFETFRTGRLREVSGRQPDGAVEVEGTPDMVLEILSDSSVTKDVVRLHAGYAAAGIAEYWRVDARRPVLGFEVFRLSGREYAPVPADAAGWVRSDVFQRSFRLSQGVNPLGRPSFTLEDRP